MNAMKAIVLVLGFVLAVPSMSQAQILVAKKGRSSYGHHPSEYDEHGGAEEVFRRHAGRKAR